MKKWIIVLLLLFALYRIKVHGSCIRAKLKQLSNDPEQEPDPEKPEPCNWNPVGSPFDHLFCPTDAKATIEQEKIEDLEKGDTVNPNPGTAPGQSERDDDLFLDQVAPLYGYLYNFYAASKEELINTASPGSWRLPVKADFDNMLAEIAALGDANNEAKYLKSKQHWHHSNRYDIKPKGNEKDNGQNIWGLNIVPHGVNWNNTYNFTSLGTYSPIWCADAPADPAWARIYFFRNPTDSTTPNKLQTDDSKLKTNGYAVRFCRNATAQEQLLSNGSLVNNFYTGNNGRTYPAVKIGTRVWTTQNLRESLYNDGTPVIRMDNYATWKNATTAYRSVYTNAPD